MSERYEREKLPQDVGQDNNAIGVQFCFWVVVLWLRLFHDSRLGSSSFFLSIPVRLQISDSICPSAPLPLTNQQHPLQSNPVHSTEDTQFDS